MVSEGRARRDRNSDKGETGKSLAWMYSLSLMGIVKLIRPLSVMSDSNGKLRHTEEKLSVQRSTTG